MKTKLNVMIDIETTGTVAGCCILQLSGRVFNDGIVDFDLYHHAFNRNIDHKTSLAHGFIDCENTMEWWEQQDPEVYSKVFSGKCHLLKAMEDFSDWLDTLQKDNPECELALWSKGMDFDFPILSHVYRALDLPVPWKYYHVNDARTILKLVPTDSLLVRAPTLPQHDAYFDCVFQVRQLLAAAKYLNITLS